VNDIIKETKQLKLLYVEDNDETREITLSILKSFFKNIISALDGKDGLEKFKTNDIDIVICDINMPNMNGLDMSKEILKIDQSIPIFIVSAYNEIDLFADAIKIGIEGYIVKPLEMKQFLQVLSKCIEKIKLKKENLEYKISLEHKVQLQVDQLLHKDKLLLQNSKMAAMGEMLDIIAHQWKQPLNTISMKADLASINIREKNYNDQDILDCSEDVKYQVSYLLNTLDEFRSFFRPTKFDETVELKKLFSSIYLLLKDSLIQNEIELIVDFDDIAFKANVNEFKHLFINLINNSKDAFIKNGIKNRKIIVRATRSFGNIKIFVDDNAGGISSSIIDNIFQQNFTTKEDIGGTGIGLYMCRLIANKHNADLDVIKIDNGTRFIINIKEYIQ